ncbi:MAG TPA: signal peptidase I [Bryobacteraceae bacterium]|jgi:signal peptidase I
MDTGEPVTPTATPPAEPSVARAAFSWLRDLTLSVVIAIIIILFLYQPVRVEGTSMMPSLINEERIFINKFVYRFSDIKRGDTVVFQFPRDVSKSYIKRVIGMPGDRVLVDHGTVIVNGTPLNEPYVPQDERDQASYPEIQVDPDCYYVLGDHRNSSNDSRNWGTVKRGYIYGKAVFVYWPLDRLGLLR